MRNAITWTSVVLLCLACAAPAHAADGYITTTFGNAESCAHPNTLKADKESLRFDLSGLPDFGELSRAAGAKPLRAVLRVSERGHRPGLAVTVTPDLPEAKPLELIGPDYNRFDATAAVKAWLAKPDANKGLKIEKSGGVDFATAVLEVSYLTAAVKPAPAVSELKPEFRSGQTFLTWKEPEDVVGDDAPTFQSFEKAVLDARAKRNIVYRIYRGDKPITVETLSSAELVREVPEALSCWYLLAVKNTEHPQKDTTKTSPLRPGNLVMADIVTRFRLADDAQPLPRATGLAVFTCSGAGKRYYAVTVAVNNNEAVAALKEGQNATAAVDEKPSTFPAIVWQKSTTPDPKHAGSCPVDGYVCWLEPPYVPAARPIEIYMPRWKDLAYLVGPTSKPAAAPAQKAPLYVNLATYGTTASEISEPIWHGARRYVAGAPTISLAEEGTLWTGQHECLGTLRSYDQGVVYNYEQRRVLAATAWAAQKPEFFTDPERVYVWGQSAGWCLRHGDVYAVVMSDGHNNYKTSKEGAKHAWRWGPPGGGKNWLGVNHLDYLDLAKFVRENPTAELPYWIGAPAYGSFPDHCLGDFGFKPWQDFLNAMKQTRRAFAATWMTNGPGPTSPIMAEMTPQIRLHQSLPAFSNCTLDTSPDTDNPKGEYRPRQGYDTDFQKRADKDENGGINLHQRWDAAGIVDGPGRWAVTIWLAGPDKNGRGGAPAASCKTDLTPRRCQKFFSKKAKPGDKFAWTVTQGDPSTSSGPGGKTLQSGTAEADKDGLVTIPAIELTKERIRVEIAKS